MIDQILVLLVCILPVILLITLSVFVGTVYRKKLVNSIMRGVRQGRFRDFSNPTIARKLRILIILTMLSTGGILLITTLVIIGILPISSNLYLAVLLVFVFVDIITSSFLFKELVNRLRD